MFGLNENRKKWEKPERLMEVIDPLGNISAAVLMKIRRLSIASNDGTRAPKTMEEEVEVVDGNCVNDDGWWRRVIVES
jgi:hypothetical protein